MSNLDSLAKQWNDAVAGIAALGPMRSGSVCAQKVKYRAKDGTRKTHGPYPILTFKEGEKTRTLRLASPEQSETVEKQVTNFREFRRLTKELVRIGKELADVEIAEKTRGKKNSSNASTRNAGKRRRRSSNE
jgi:hypothetical protein